jgi:hypothetical protein
MRQGLLPHVGAAQQLLDDLHRQRRILARPKERSLCSGVTDETATRINMSRAGVPHSDTARKFSTASSTGKRCGPV